MELFDDYRTKMLRDRVAGRWVVKNRTPGKVRVETIGRSLAFTLRILLRKNIGTETFTFWNVLWGFLWIRLCNVINNYEPESKEALTHLLNPLMFSDVGTSFLSVFSFFFLVSIGWYYYRAQFPTNNRPFTDVISRGKSVPLKSVINQKKWFQRKGFVQSAIAPVLGLILGYALLNIQTTIGVGFFFFVSSIALLIDEVNYHSANFRLMKIRKAKIIRGKRERDNFDIDDFEEFD